MNFTKTRLIIAAVIVLVLILLFRSCGDNTRQVIIQQPHTQQQVQMEREYLQNEPNVVVVQQPPQTVYNNSGIDAGHIAAGALGYMAGKSSNSRSYSNRPTVTNKYYTKKVYVNKPSKKFYGSSSTKRYKRR